MSNYLSQIANFFGVNTLSLGSKNGSVKKDGTNSQKLDFTATSDSNNESSPAEDLDSTTKIFANFSLFG